jgi:DNA polymerase-3 subunit alpha
MTHLHIHNHMGSRLDAIGDVEDYAKKAYELGHKSLAVTDHGRLSAIWEHQQACKKHNIKSIIGVEMYLSDELEKFEPLEEKRLRTRNSHIVLLVKNKEGYKNLLKLNYLSMHDEKHFYYNPRITEEELFAQHDGLIVGTACLANPFITLARAGEISKAEKAFERYLSVFKSDFYTEVQLNELDSPIDKLDKGQHTANQIMINLANKYGVPIVLTGDVHYLEKGHDKLQTLAIAIRDKATIDNLQFEFESRELFFHDTEDFIDFNDRFKYGYSRDNIITWLGNTDDIAEKCNFEIPAREKLFLPKMTSDDDKALIEKGKLGLVKRFKLNKYEEVPVEYRKRLERELEIIIRKGFSSYFLNVEDITQFSIKEDIYGRIGRGSVGGSLLAYALEIHNLDPIHYGLLFERFLSESRSADLVLDYFCDK